MSTAFGINLVAWGDKAGLGLYLIGHYRQHLVYNAVLAARTPPVIIDEFPILEIGDSDEERRAWLDDHNNWHQLIRPYANVTGVDLSAVDFDDREEFYDWQDVHKSEHALLDTAFGVA
jgi:hypothetical protein